MTERVNESGNNWVSESLVLIESLRFIESANIWISESSAHQRINGSVSLWTNSTIRQNTCVLFIPYLLLNRKIGTYPTSQSGVAYAKECPLQCGSSYIQLDKHGHGYMDTETNA